MQYLDFSEALENPDNEYEFSGRVSPEIKPSGIAPHKLAGDADISFKYFADYDANLHLNGYVRVPVVFVCDRCGAVFEKNLFLNLDEEISPKIDEDSELTYDLPRIEIDKFITSFILASFPSKVLCREDCKGLCPRCGANLNDGDCGCKNEETK